MTTFAVWSSAWLSGNAAPDDVLDAMAHWAPMHEVVADDDGTATVLDLPADGEPAATPAALLGALRRGGAESARLVLPVPGDVRGLGGRSAFATTALRHGEAAVFGGAALGLVTEEVAEGILRWTVFGLPEPPRAEHVPLGEAEHGLTQAVRDAAGALATLDVARDRPGVRAEIAALLRLATRAPWPDGMPARALRVLQRASEVGAMISLAAEDEPGGALSASAAVRRSEALRPVHDAVRTARSAAVDEAVRALSDHAERR
jgi:hypothetical protein